MQEISRCVSCDYQTADRETKCPRCGRRLRTLRQARRLGWFQVVIGGFLVALMGVITIVVSSVISQSGKPGATTVYTGSQSDLMFTYAIFAIVIAIGLVSIAGGIMTIRYGKTNKLILLLMIVLAIAFYVVAMAFNRSRP